jgi:SAM-dependent methyltransferase
MARQQTKLVFAPHVLAHCADSIMEQFLKNFAVKVTNKLTGHRSLQIPGSEAQIVEPADFAAFLAALEAKLESSIENEPPNKLLEGVSDDLWLWLCTEGYRRSSSLRNLLPGMPDETVQVTYTGDTGDSVLRDGWAAFKLFKSLHERYVGSITDCQNILDFGCGWGRIIRFFLKDIAPTKLWGADPVEEMVSLCKQQNRWCNFEAIRTKPPSHFQDNTFDLIYSFSVFSHLSEKMHMSWLPELGRILRPGGLLIATTRGREFIEQSASPRKYENIDSAMSIFSNTQQSLADFDSGKYCFSQIVHEGEWSYWGETAIPKDYVLGNWSEWFTFLDYIDDRNRCSQNVIVMSKPS